MSLGLVNSTMAQVSIGIGLPNVSIGINLPAYPRLERVPNYPVYYAPQVNSIFFFYDGLYWVYERDDWYASSWYNGPWAIVSPQAVPVFILGSPCATTAVLLHISAAGGPMQRRSGPALGS